MQQNEALDRPITVGMLIKFAMPTILTMVFMSIYSTVDGIFVSRLVGTHALSAVNIVMPMVLLTLAVGSMFGAGGTALVARKLGEGIPQEARENFSLLAVTAFVVSATLAAVGLLALDPLLHLLGANPNLEPEVYQFAKEYAVPTLLFVPLTIFGMLSHMSFITVGRAHFGLALSVAGGLTNIALDYLFIAVLGMGIRGAAIATGIGYCFPSLVGMAYFGFKRSGSLHLVRPKLDWSVIGKSCSNGASEMVTNLSTALVITLFNNILMSLAGAAGVAAITIILYVQGLLSAIYMGYSFGISPIISYNYGKQDEEKLKRIFAISLRTILGISLFAFGVSLLFAGPLVGIFARGDTGVFTMAVQGFRIFAFCFLFMGSNAFASAFFTALNNGRVSALLSFFRNLVFIVGAGLLLPRVWGVDGVWLSIPVAEFASILMTIYFFRKMRTVYRYA